MMASQTATRAREALAVGSQTVRSLASTLRCSPEESKHVLDELCRAGEVIDAGGVYLRMSAISVRPAAFTDGFGFDDDDDAPVTEMLWHRSYDSEEDVDDMPTEVLRIPVEALVGFEEDQLDHTLAREEGRVARPGESEVEQDMEPAQHDGLYVQDSSVSVLVFAASIAVAFVTGMAVVSAAVVFAGVRF
jgi:hypothetical protein